MAEQEKEKAQNEEKNYLDQILEQTEKLQKANQELQDRLKKQEIDNNTLMKRVLQGQEVEVDVIEPVDLKQLRKELFSDPDSNQLNDIEYVKKALQLREAVIAEGGKDPFMGFGQKYESSDNEEFKAQRVADALKQCVENARGDNGLFIAELNRILR